MKRLLTISLLIGIVTINAQGINNFVHPEGYETSTWGELGEVKEFGQGDKSMILVPGWCFDWTMFKDFIDQYEDTYKIYAVTIPGFGSTQAPPMPADSSNFRELHWTNGVIKGIRDLIREKGLSKPILVSQFTYSNLITMRFALDYPEEVGQVIILSGMAKFTANYPSYEPRSLDQRIAYVEKFLGPRWFKTVNKETWDDGNFQAPIFTKDSVKAVAYWETMSAVPIPTAVRYLCESYCTDLSLEYASLKTPTLVVIPSFTDSVLSDPEMTYLTSFFHHSWLGAKPGSENISIVTLTDTNAFMIDDQPKKLFKLLDEFIKGELNQYQLVR